MQKINTEILEKKWEKSKKKINKLLEDKDNNTLKMMENYKLYISSPFDLSAKIIFEYSFNNWYQEKMKDAS